MASHENSGEKCKAEGSNAGTNSGDANHAVSPGNAAASSSAHVDVAVVDVAGVVSLHPEVVEPDHHQHHHHANAAATSASPPGASPGASASASPAASRRSTAADIESDEGEMIHFQVDGDGRRKSKNLKEAVAHLKEEALRR